MRLSIFNPIFNAYLATGMNGRVASIYALCDMYGVDEVNLKQEIKRVAERNKQYQRYNYSALKKKIQTKDDLAYSKNVEWVRNNYGLNQQESFMLEVFDAKIQSLTFLDDVIDIG